MIENLRTETNYFERRPPIFICVLVFSHSGSDFDCFGVDCDLMRSQP